MAGLVAYASSDEEDSDPQEPQVQAKEIIHPGEKDSNVEITKERDNDFGAPPKSLQALDADEQTEPARSDAETAARIDTDVLSSAQQGVVSAPPQAENLGVMIGPSRPPPESQDLSGGLPSMDDVDEPNDIGPPPLSPYSAEKARLRDLTLPRVPDFDIPGSPPGTPPPGLEALTKKFDMFLDLKCKKGTHFNARLAQSSAVQSPALMDKLMAFVGLDGDTKEEDSWSRRSKAQQDGGTSGRTTFTTQYDTTISNDIWCPSALPQWAYRTELRRLQEEMAKQRARAPGEKMEFVLASDGSGNPNRGGRGTEKADAVGGMARRKTRFD